MIDPATALAAMVIVAGLIFVVVQTRSKPEPRPRRPTPPVNTRSMVEQWALAKTPEARHRMAREADVIDIDRLLNSDETMRFVIRVRPSEQTGLCIPTVEVYGKSVKYDPDGRGLVWPGIGPQGSLGNLLLDERLLERLAELAFADPKVLLTRLRNDLLVELGK